MNSYSTNYSVLHVVQELHGACSNAAAAPDFLAAARKTARAPHRTAGHHHVRMHEDGPRQHQRCERRRRRELATGSTGTSTRAAFVSTTVRTRTALGLVTPRTQGARGTSTGSLREYRTHWYGCRLGYAPHTGSTSTSTGSLRVYRTHWYGSRLGYAPHTGSTSTGSLRA